jgi:hypothetical protein
MADDKRRAEIEYLIACELDKPSVYMDGPTKASQRKAKAIMQILDRVHDARDDDKNAYWREKFEIAERSARAWRSSYDGLAARLLQAGITRSPQGEDHE